MQLFPVVGEILPFECGQPIWDGIPDYNDLCIADLLASVASPAALYKPVGIAQLGDQNMGVEITADFNSARAYEQVTTPTCVDFL